MMEDSRGSQSKLSDITSLIILKKKIIIIIICWNTNSTAFYQ